MLKRRVKGRSRAQRKRRADDKLSPVVVAAHHAELRKLPKLRRARNKAMAILRDQKIQRRRQLRRKELA
jgi:hypothetical protein